uniref:Uncharacterized protein LOC114340488 isoform X1 n=1 Tax=Diabrotica virgifera virgifera TaxID=50390 RepID=A0A6P7GT88_DIAVI
MDTITESAINRNNNNHINNNTLEIINETLDISQNIPNQINSNTSQEESSNNTRYFSLPYIRDITPSLTRLLKINDNIKIAHKNVRTLGNLYNKQKDLTPQLLKSNVIYKISCADCELHYIGETSRKLKDRITSHKSDCRLHPERCELATHVTNKQHNMDWESTKILSSECNSTKRKFLEMTYIALTPSCINKRTDIQHLSAIYSNLLSKDKPP